MSVQYAWPGVQFPTLHLTPITDKLSRRKWHQEPFDSAARDNQ
jgi:hypothetical protein